MPTYLYECETCGREIEVEHSIHDEPLTEISHISRHHVPHEADEDALCLKCEGPMRRLIAGKTSFALKGTGWTGKNYV
jgi:predicted nucleic acid-binding Zn ribbon protein